MNVEPTTPAPAHAALLRACDLAGSLRDTMTPLAGLGDPAVAKVGATVRQLELQLAELARRVAEGRR